MRSGDFTASRNRRQQRAGYLNHLYQPFGFRADGSSFLTKRGGIGYIYRLAGEPFEGRSEGELAAITSTFARALARLDQQCHAYVYMVKRALEPITAPMCASEYGQRLLTERAQYLNTRPPMYRVDLYAALVHQGTPPRVHCLTGFSSPQTRAFLTRHLDDTSAALDVQAGDFEAQLVSLRLERLDKHSAFRFLRLLVTRDDAGVLLRRDDHVDYFMSDERVEDHGAAGFLRVGQDRVRVLSLKDVPAYTFAAMWSDFVAIPGELIVCLEWQRLDPDGVRSWIIRQQRHFHNGVYRLRNYFFGGDTADVLPDEGKRAMADELGEAMAALAREPSAFYGNCSLRVAVRGVHADQAASEARRVVAAHGGAFINEDYGLLPAWLSLVPGNDIHNHRYLHLQQVHAADLAPLFTVSRGPERGYYGHAPLAVFETRHRTTYRFHLFDDSTKDTGHIALIAPTGAGKSTTAAFLMDHVTQYQPTTRVIFDIGRSYARLCQANAGSYFDFGLEMGCPINPLASDPTPAQLMFLLRFVKMLLDGTPVSVSQEDAIYRAIERVYDGPADRRSLSTLVRLMPQQLEAPMKKWLRGGRFGRIFDHVDDSLEINRFQVFEFEQLTAVPELLGPIQFYCLGRLMARIEQRLGLTVCLIDEMGEMLKFPLMREHVQDILPQLRKRQGVMLLATQHLDQLIRRDVLSDVVQSCPTKLLLANADLVRDQYAAAFKLNDAELDLVARMQKQKQIGIKRANRPLQVVDLNLDPASLLCYSNATDHRQPVTRELVTS